MTSYLLQLLCQCDSSLGPRPPFVPRSSGRVWSGQEIICDSYGTRRAVETGDVKVDDVISWKDVGNPIAVLGHLQGEGDVMIMSSLSLTCTSSCIVRSWQVCDSGCQCSCNGGYTPTI